MEQLRRDLNDMAIFAEIVAADGITAAADRLGLPKSNVSRRLKRLEERLGVQLIERSTRANRLTPVGKCYADYCRLMLEEADAADNVIAKSLEGPAGELRISASVLVGQQIVAPVLSKYLQKYPDVSASLVLTNHRVNLIEDGFDLAFRIGPNEDSSMISQSLGACSLHLYAGRQFVDGQGTPETPEDLSAFRCLIMSDADTAHGWRLSDGERVCEPQINAVAHVNDFTSLKTMALANAGIAMLPDYAVFDDVQSGTLQIALPQWQGPVTELSAIYPSRRGATAKVRLLIEDVRQHLAGLLH